MSNFKNNVEFNQNQLLNALLQVLSSAPGTPAEGQIWYDSTSKRLIFRTNAANIDPTARANHSGTQTVSTLSDFNSSVDSRIAGHSDVTSKAPIASPTFTGTPAAPTAAGGTNSTQLATTAFVQAAVAALINSAPGALDTLNELAAAMGNDANFAATVTTALAGKVGTTGAETIAGVKTFSSTPLIPDEAYGSAWNGKLEPATKNAVFDKIETLSGGGLHKYQATIGDNSTTSFSINQATHGGAADSSNYVFVEDDSSGERVTPKISVNKANGTVTIDFSIAPTTNQYRVHIWG